MSRNFILAACAVAALSFAATAVHANEQQDKPKRVPSMMTGTSKPADKATQPAKDTEQAQKDDGKADRKRCRDEKGKKKQNC